MGGVARETAGAVFHHIPGVVAGLPGQRGPEGVEEVIQGPGNDHVVVCAHQEGYDGGGHTHTWTATRGGEGGGGGGKQHSKCPCR